MNVGFRVQYKNKEDFITGLKKLREIGALGKEINFGTYLLDSYLVSDIIKEYKYLYTVGPKCEDDIVEFNIEIPRKQIIKDFKHLIGKGDILVSLTTQKNIDDGDINNKIVLFDDMVKETLILMNINNV